MTNSFGFGGHIDGVVRAKRPARLPVVLSPAEVKRVLERLEGVPHLGAWLLYGGGLRLVEALRLRLKDLELERRRILVRDAKEGRDRVTTLAPRIRAGS